MPPQDDTDSGRPLRADARRNRELILAAAREVFVEQGMAAPLDAIAGRAGVGIATLYRRFPDREALVREIALDVIAAVIDAANAAAEAQGSALRSFIARVVDLQLGELLGALFPALEAQVRTDPVVAQAAQQLNAAVGRVAAAARDAGRLRPDVTVDDLVLLLASLTRPLPGLPEPFAEQQLPRMLHLLVEGLEPGPHSPAPPAPQRPADWPPLPERPGS